MTTTLEVTDPAALRTGESEEFKGDVPTHCKCGLELMDLEYYEPDGDEFHVWADKVVIAYAVEADAHTYQHSFRGEFEHDVVSIYDDSWLLYGGRCRQVQPC